MNTGEKLSTNKGDHFHRYLAYAESLLTKYNGIEPFHLYLKKYFAANKKHGSKDRKLITSLCYNYFRLGFGVTSNAEISQKVVLSTFLTAKESSPFLESLNPEWNEKADRPVSEKLAMVKDIFDPEKIFPYQNDLSDQVNFYQFSLSFLAQPKLFIRIRPGYKDAVLGKLRSANISFEELNEHCLSFSNNEKISQLINIDQEAVIQDYNSQKTGDFLTSIEPPKSDISVWDCCAASGGKSILAYDLLKNIELTVSDTRKNILENLHFRFSEAGIKNYHSFIADLSISSGLPSLTTLPQLIIADVPCTGSGTWARTPAQLIFFDKKSIDQYALLQRKIVKNTVKYLASGGYLLYITCSVFKKENEENVEFIQKESGMQLLKTGYLPGYEMQADTLFAAILKK